jgi:hypothetical protein
LLATLLVDRLAAFLGAAFLVALLGATFLGADFLAAFFTVVLRTAFFDGRDAFTIDAVDMDSP